MRYKNPTCGTSVTTPTGTFTYFKTPVTACQAKIECANRGQILAPITNQHDLNALRSIAKLEDPSCKFHYGGLYQYHIGLEVNRCRNRLHRLFSNNVVYNKTLHGNLYRWVGNKSEAVNRGSYSPYYKKLFIVRDFGLKQRFICLKPNANNASAEPIIKKEIVYNTSSVLLLACAAFMGAFVVGVVLMVSSKKKEKVKNDEIVKLKSENDLLKNEKGYYKKEYEKLLKKIST